MSHHRQVQYYINVFSCSFDRSFRLFFFLKKNAILSQISICVSWICDSCAPIAACKHRTNSIVMHNYFHISIVVYFAIVALKNSYQRTQSMMILQSDGLLLFHNFVRSRFLNKKHIVSMVVSCATSASVAAACSSSRPIERIN